MYGRNNKNVQEFPKTRTILRRNVTFQYFICTVYIHIQKLFYQANKYFYYTLICKYIILSNTRSRKIVRAIYNTNNITNIRTKPVTILLQRISSGFRRGNERIVLFQNYSIFIRHDIIILRSTGFLIFFNFKVHVCILLN